MGSNLQDKVSRYILREDPTEEEREIFAKDKEGIITALKDLQKSDKGIVYWAWPDFNYEYKDQIESNAQKAISQLADELEKKDLPDLNNITDCAGNPVLYYVNSKNDFFMHEYPNAADWSFEFYITRRIDSEDSLNSAKESFPDVKQKTGLFLHVDRFGAEWYSGDFVKNATKPLMSTEHWGAYKPDVEWSNIANTVQFNTKEILEYIDSHAKSGEIPQEEINNIERYIMLLDLPDLTDQYALVKNSETEKVEARPYIYATAISAGYESGYGDIRIYHGISPYDFDEVWSYDEFLPFEVDDDKNFNSLKLLAQFPIRSNLNYFDDRKDDSYFARYAHESLPFLYREKQIRPNKE